MSRKPIVLCVDDTPSILEGRKMLLEENGYRVLTATNGKQAREAFMANSVDLVVLDYHMPEMDGGIVAARMKESKPDVPVMLLSGDECLPEEVLETVDCFLSKSEPIAGFLEKVDYLLSLRILFRPPAALTKPRVEDGVNISRLNGAEAEEFTDGDRQPSRDPTGFRRAA
jgi:two-component system, NtrC family, nitrogen regulation response regulator NtrX